MAARRVIKPYTEFCSTPHWFEVPRRRCDSAVVLGAKRGHGQRPPTLHQRGSALGSTGGPPAPYHYTLHAGAPTDVAGLSAITKEHPWVLEYMIYHEAVIGIVYSR